LEELPLTVTFSKFCSQRFTASPIDVVVFKCCKKICLTLMGLRLRVGLHTADEVWRLRLPCLTVVQQLTRFQLTNGCDSWTCCLNFGCYPIFGMVKLQPTRY